MEILFFTYILSCLCILPLASSRQIAIGPAFLASFFFTPIIGLIVVLRSKENPEYTEFELCELEGQHREFHGDNNQAIAYYKQALWILIKMPKQYPKVYRNKVKNQAKRIEIRNQITKLGGEMAEIYYTEVVKINNK